MLRRMTLLAKCNYTDYQVLTITLLQIAILKLPFGQCATVLMASIFLTSLFYCIIYVLDGYMYE